MKVDEIRTCLKTWTKEDLVKLYTQTYRRVPKDAKEELDDLIRSGFNSEKQTKLKTAVQRNEIAELKGEIETFISNAKEGYYHSPNRIVSKKERSNWRFTVKRMIKALMIYQPMESEYEESNIMLCRIYDILGRATSFYTFASQDPYHAVGYPAQAEFFSIICKRIREGTLSQEVLEALVSCGCNGNNDAETVDHEIHFVLLNHFDSPEEQEMLLETAEKVFAPIRKTYEARYKGIHSFYISEERIELGGKYDSLLWFIAAIKVAQERYQEAYDYVMEIKPEKDDEITLYCLLTYYVPKTEAWVQLYDRAKKDGIKPRAYLQEQYDRIRESLKAEQGQP